MRLQLLVSFLRFACIFHVYSLHLIIVIITQLCWYIWTSFNVNFIVREGNSCASLRRHNVHNLILKAYGNGTHVSRIYRTRGMHRRCQTRSEEKNRMARRRSTTTRGKDAKRDTRLCQMPQFASRSSSAQLKSLFSKPSWNRIIQIKDYVLHSVTRKAQVFYLHFLKY